jgi:BMFP domain-containing protein YqiC
VSPLAARGLLTGLAAVAVIALAELGVCIALGVQLARTNDELASARKANADVQARLLRTRAEVSASREALRYELNANENLRGNGSTTIGPVPTPTTAAEPASRISNVATSLSEPPAGNITAALAAERRAEQERDDLLKRYRTLRDDYDAQTKVLFRLQNELSVLQHRIDRLRGRPHSGH